MRLTGSVCLFQSLTGNLSGAIASAYLETMIFEKCLQIANKRPNNIFIAILNGKVVAVVGYGVYRNELLQEYEEVYGIYVLKDYYGKKFDVLMNCLIIIRSYLVL